MTKVLNLNHIEGIRGNRGLQGKFWESNGVVMERWNYKMYRSQMGECVSMYIKMGASTLLPVVTLPLVLGVPWYCSNVLVLGNPWY